MSFLYTNIIRSRENSPDNIIIKNILRTLLWFLVKRFLLFFFVSEMKIEKEFVIKRTKEYTDVNEYSGSQMRPIIRFQL